ncbi:cytidylyltransferase domain-containing protein [Murimonas intestini]|uniref:cytidylyltransferase domain-containing protein n=1 Tax=Murimonas intestini TaxID=1337051 RepID=UPI0011DE4871|nr:cytidyltransferase [Murimonas intestini]
MKIVAVIPARANSKRIPNKNIRLLNNRPLIYYAINNAKESKYITDIIVTTDSSEIETIAQQMHVMCHKRNIALCRDETTLDAVVYDAVKDLECDFVITMQPTSPTLQVETLDMAIEYCIKESLDTVISAFNHPRLAWKIDGTKKIPDYSERMNCQFLPPYYYETGAFLITKKAIITENNRIGQNVEIFEVSREESINIDTFQDLAFANLILQKKKVGIYVNGNNHRGTGHIYRALEIADEFYTKPDIYFDKNQTEIGIFGNTTHKLIAVNGLDELLPILKAKNYDIFINDILSTSLDYMIAIRNCLPNGKIINFEDDGEGAYKADLVFNALYREGDIQSIKAGEKYYIASKLFMFYEPIKIKEKVHNIFISFGGADPQNYTDRILEIITQEKYRGLNFFVVLGRAKTNVDKLMEYNMTHNITVLYDIQNMPEVMSKCDIALTSRGRTGYELAILGIPTIAMAQNKREEKHGFVNHENGFNYLGLNPSDTVIESNLDLFIHLSKEEREHYQSILLSKDLRNGRRRVMNLINSL